MPGVPPSDRGFPQVPVVLYIALFGALGCLARYFLSGWVHGMTGRALPYGTFAVNGVGAFLIGLYLGYGSLRTILGAAGSLVVLMVWMAYSAQIIFFGAKFARVYASAIGKPILPASNAVRMKLSVSDDLLDE